MPHPHAMFGQFYMHCSLPPVDAGDASIVYPIFYAPVNCVVTAVAVVPQADVAGDDTNRKNLNLINAGDDGDGTDEVGNLDLATGVDLAALDMTTIPFGDDYADGVELAAGEVLALEIELVNGGVATPEMLVVLGLRENGV
jgi:hypothetical protein